MADQIFWGDELTETGTTQLHEFGTERVEHNNTYGERVWVYVKTGAGALALGEGCMIPNGGTSYGAVIVSGTGIAAQRMAGVAQHAIAATTCGWVLKRGFGEMASDGTTTADTPQTTAANGRFTDATIGTDTVVAHASETEDPAGAGGLFTGYISVG